MTVFFSTLVILIGSVSLYLSGDISISSSSDTFSHTFEVSESAGPIYIEYDPNTPKQFLYGVHHNTHWWHLNGAWVNHPPVTAGRFGDIYRSSISEGLIELYTCNYQYPLLKKSLPLNLTYFGCFSIEDLGPIADKTTYSTYFADGVFSVYTKLSNKTVMFNSDEEPAFNGALLEWYRSWGNLQEFSLYRHIYFPLDRDHSNWMNLHSLMVNFYPHPDMVSSDEIWEDCESFNLTTIDFVKTETKVNLLSVDPLIWDGYTQQQALFRYYDVSTGEIGFWTPKDLILNHEAIRIAKMLGKQPEEVLAIFQNWLFKAGTPPSLYLNYIGSETYDYVKDAWHEMEYVY